MLTILQLYDAICALSLQSLAFKGRASWEEAFQYYEQALSPERIVQSTDDLTSDNTLFLHFLLLIYDVCFVCHLRRKTGADVTTMWVQHLQQLLRIVRQRNSPLKNGSQIYIVWSVGLIDIEATLAGGGSGEFVRHLVDMASAYQPHAFPTGVISPWASLNFKNELDVFPIVQNWHREVIFVAGKTALEARRLRIEADMRHPTTPLTPHGYAVREQEIRHVQAELFNASQRSYPSFIPGDAPLTALELPPRVMHVFIWVSFPGSTFSVSKVLLTYVPRHICTTTLS